MPNVVDLFCGAGGLSLGFGQAGFRVLAGQDMDAAAGLTFAGSHTGARFVGGDIRAVRGGDLSGGERVDVVVGGPPCQGFSRYNHARGLDDPRTGLWREYARLVGEMRPSWLVMENVTGMSEVAGGEAVRASTAALEGMGYRVRVATLRAEEHGVPQRRRRVFLVAGLGAADFRWPEPSHGAGLLPVLSVWDAISDLPPLANGEGEEVSAHAGPPLNAYQEALRAGAPALFDHVAPRLSAINMERQSHVPEGGSWRDIPPDLLPPGMRRAKRSDHTRRYGRLRRDEPACTVLTKADPHWGAALHPLQPRAFTPREHARLQGFPDRVRFMGTATERYRQIGNAVPPPLARAVGMALLGAMR